ncbi:SCO1664 family protein [Streptomyces spiramenti]|uniref:SCO1664 family protein n=1 Tax=Streptomyces spiramenti TaxID=2720606 RepID=UPI003B83579B
MTPQEVEQLLTTGSLAVRGRLTGASNAVFYATVTAEGRSTGCVYKPVAGEQPLWDFPDGTLAAREVAAGEVCRAMGWELVPPTVLREGPHGPGMCQQWVGPPPPGAEGPGGEDRAGSADDADDGTAVPVTAPAGHLPSGTTATADPGAATAEAGGPAVQSLLALVDGDEPGPGWRAVGYAQVAPDRTALLVHADDPDLRRLAVLDAVINNADRKGGHLLTAAGGGLRAIDHGVTFHTENKLRTLLWGWAGEPLDAEAHEALAALDARLADGEPTAARLARLVSPRELAALRARVAALRADGVHPLPGGDWPAVPWPPV